ncbi:hypothetical protein SynBIOSU31_02101 [Synechococcus sp. BIOS-U3-1]|nr:hypothetical protein SynBIOSU31_02101 [Synechococcus sp. BIOS-U3-1]
MKSGCDLRATWFTSAQLRPAPISGTSSSSETKSHKTTGECP